MQPQLPIGGLPAAISQPPGVDPTDGGLFTPLIGYYVTYAIGLWVLRHRHHRA